MRQAHLGWNLHVVVAGGQSADLKADQLASAAGHRERSVNLDPKRASNGRAAAVLLPECSESLKDKTDRPAMPNKRSRYTCSSGRLRSAGMEQRGFPSRSTSGYRPVPQITRCWPFQSIERRCWISSPGFLVQRRERPFLAACPPPPCALRGSLALQRSLTTPRRP